MSRTVLLEQGLVSYGDPVEIVVQGERIHAARGQTVAAVLLAHGAVFRRTRTGGKPRGLFCGMGMCFDCVVEIDGMKERACMVKVEQGMQIGLPRRPEG